MVMIEMTDKKYTTIRVSETTLNDFNSEGCKGETSDDLLIRILKELREYRRTCG
jgi:hypothetical protein